MSIQQPFDFFIQWHLTERCNLRCSHCYQTGEKQDEMSLPEIRDGIQEIAETLNIWKRTYDMDFTPSVNISGGEPLLRQDLYQVVEEFRLRGFEIYLLTNGTLIDRRVADRLRRSGVRGVQVSIEGTEDVHDAIRGKMSFSASVRGARNLLDAGMEVTLNATLSKLNADSFLHMIRLSSELGVQNLGFSRIVPTGRGRGMMKEMVNTDDLRSLYEKIFSQSENGLTIVTGDPVASQSRNRGDSTVDTGDIPAGGCAAGLSGLTILPDGTLVPCRRLPVPLGNIRKDSLREVWAVSETLNALRDRTRYKGKCRSCSSWSRCRGCRAIAYAYSEGGGKGDLLAEDPQCFLRTE